MKKDVLTVKELAAELRMSLKSIQRDYRKREIPVQLSLCSLVVAPGYI
jgi:predicted DNA-binding transcriptional regulator YafY